MFYRAIKKYGWDNFEHIIFAEQLTHAEAINMERLLIALYKTNCNRYKDPSFGYNMTDGGEGGLGRVVSEETRNKMSEAQKRRCSNPEERERRSRFMKEYLSDPKIREKMSQAMKGKCAGEKNYWYGKRRYGEENPNYGNKWSDKSRQQLSEYSKNRTEEHLKHISESLKLRLSDPTKHPMFGKGEAVVQLEKDGKYVKQYASAAEAHRETGINQSHIGECCRGVVPAAGGYMWVFLKDYDPNKQYVHKNKHLKRVVQLMRDGEFINTFDSIAEASRSTKVNRADIGSCCRNKIKSAGGYRWMYLEDYEKHTKQNDLNNMNE